MSTCCEAECSEPAEWHVRWGLSPDDYTEACTAHVGDLLTDAEVHTIHRL